MARNFQVWREIITEDGKRGSYCCANGLLTVTTPNGSKTTQLGGSTPKSLTALFETPGCRRAMSTPHAKYRRPSFPTRCAINA